MNNSIYANRRHSLQIFERWDVIDVILCSKLSIVFLLTITMKISRSIINMRLEMLGREFEFPNELRIRVIAVKWR